MIYLPEMAGPWGVRKINPTAEETEDQRKWGLRDMCDAGAAEVAAGRCDGLEFRIMPDEREYVRHYMETNHPTVKFHCQWPSFGVEK